MDPLQGFLKQLGARLRSLRQEAGLSLAQTARSAEVSRRYLTEAEAGRANPSVLVLLRLARTLDVTTSDLLELPHPRNIERVALVGLRGAGKSTVGRLVSRRLEVPFCELDARVEELAGLSLGEIFDLHGEGAFHRFEGEALEAVLAEGGRAVIAAGGSIVDSEPNYRRLRETCRTVWLRAGPAEHFRRVVDQGDRRPMRDRPRALEELQAILARREPLYALCDRTLETSGREAEEVAREIVAELDQEAP